MCFMGFNFFFHVVLLIVVLGIMVPPVVMQSWAA